jgi:hypothetical protein
LAVKFGWAMTNKNGKLVLPDFGLNFEKAAVCYKYE